MKLIISFDTTGSMRPASLEVARRIEAFTQTALQVIPDLEIGLIAHGDYYDTYDPKFSGFCNDAGKLRNFLNFCGNTNGFGNGGEAYEWVMHIINDMELPLGSVVIFVGDEPAHEGSKARFSWRAELQKLVKNATVYQVRCLDRFDSRIYHSKVAEIAGTPLLSLAQFSDLVEVLTAISLRQNSVEAVETYADTIQMNRNLAEIFEQLTGKKQRVAQTFSNKLESVHPSRFQRIHVPEAMPIRAFVERLGIPYKIGRGFYQLVKREEIQENKEVVLRDKHSGDMFTGAYARELIGIPYGKRGKLSPNSSFAYDVYVQSTSVNRKLDAGTMFLYET